jgi:murein DD-endopeptidase MepM/ murein hydrolase activator NlpD
MADAPHLHRAQGDPLSSRVDRLMSAAQERARQPRFPVAGGGSFGEAAARYGAARSGHVHEGQDVFAPAGTPLVAVTGGTVLETGNDGGRGNYVGFYSPRERRTYVYLHMQSPAPVKAGSPVKAGQRLGELGCTGSCFGDHLHFEVRKGRGLEAPAQDPLPFLRSLQAENR